jgi:hypothetical protein
VAVESGASSTALSQSAGVWGRQRPRAPAAQSQAQAWASFGLASAVAAMSAGAAWKSSWAAL